MRTQAQGEGQTDFSQLCRYHGFQLGARVSPMPSAPTSLAPAGSLPQGGLQPEAEKGWGAVPGAGQLPRFLLEAPPPRPRLASPITLVSPTLQAGLPVRRPSQAQALVHLSSTRRLIKPPRKQGQPAGAEEGPLWAVSGFRAVLVPILWPQKARVWAT